MLTNNAHIPVNLNILFSQSMLFTDFELTDNGHPTYDHELTINYEAIANNDRQSPGLNSCYKVNFIGNTFDGKLYHADYKLYFLIEEKEAEKRLHVSTLLMPPIA